jgi:hypothetical protein
MFGNKVVRRIFGPKREEVSGQWRILCSKEPHNLYSSSSIWVIKLRRIRLVEHVAGMQEIGVHIECWLEKIRGRDYLGDIDVHWKTILICIKKQDEGVNWINQTQDRD